MVVYNKLIRDKIPEIIRGAGKRFDIRELDDNEYRDYLDKKLQEELNEYYKDGDIEELADLLEVVYAIVQHRGMSTDEFETLRISKREKRGGFEKKLLLLEVED